MKLPKNLICWSIWLLPNSEKSILIAYEIWFANINRLFRWLYKKITYLILPVNKVIQILAYLKLVRLLLLIIAFVLGLFTDAKVLKTNFSDV